MNESGSVLELAKQARPHPLPLSPGERGGRRSGRGEGDLTGRTGAAHANPRDASRDVPILQQPTWNHEVAAYFYFGGISSGAFVLGALADALGGERQRGLARTAYAVAFASMLPCPPLLIDDLGVPSRFHHMLRLFKPSSPMNLGAWTLTAHGVFATLLAGRLLAEDGKLPLVGRLLLALPEAPLAAGGIPTALALGGYTGVLLGTTSIPVWSSSPLLGALFMAGSLSTGAAAVSLASALSGRDLAVAHDVLTPLNVALGAAELAVLGGYVATSGPARRILVRGKARLLLAGAAAALAAATALEVAGAQGLGERRLLSGLAAGAALLGGALLRWGVVSAGHDSARDREGTLEATQPSPRAPGWGNLTSDPPAPNRSRP